MTKQEKDQILLQELTKINQGQKSVMKMVYIKEDEILPLWDMDFLISDTKVKIHSPEKGRLTAYAITRCTDLTFFLHKSDFRYWWTDFEVNPGVKSSVRQNAIVYEDMPVDILVAQKVMLLDGWKGKNISEWYDIFDKLIQFIKMSPSGINGKTLPNFDNILKF